MKPKPYPLQHDDHIWLTVLGEGWAIRKLTPTCIYLWRGYITNLQYCEIDITRVNWTAYCDKAVAMLKGN